MKRTISAWVAALALCYSPAWAGGAAVAVSGIDFAWNDCPSDGGVATASGACNTDAGLAASAVGSYLLAGEQPQFQGVFLVIDGQVHDATALPDWWQFVNPGSCRQSALSAAFAFPSQARVYCHDGWGGQAVVGYVTYETSTTAPGGMDPTAFRITIAAAVPNPVDLLPGVEYLSFVLDISNAGTSTCAGCATPATLVLSSIKSNQADGTYQVLTQPLVNNTIDWEGATTAAVNRSWGQVKGLYR